MSVQLSKAIILAAISVQAAQTTQIISLPTTNAALREDSLSSQEYRKCKRRIHKLESAVDELRHVLSKYMQVPSSSHESGRTDSSSPIAETM